MALIKNKVAWYCDLQVKNTHAIMFMLKNVPKFLFIPLRHLLLQVLFYLAGNLKMVSGSFIFNKEVNH